MKNNKHILLVHYRYPQIREGFDIIARLLPFPVSVKYANLDEDGIIKKLHLKPDAIIILMNEGDSDFNLSFKIKLFATEIPLIVITPPIPDSFRLYLNDIGVNKIIQLPMKECDISNIITRILFKENNI